MALPAVQDCLIHVPSHFDLTRLAAKRARQLSRGAEAKLPWRGDKSTVLALREIAEGQVGIASMQEPELPLPALPEAEFEPLDGDFFSRFRIRGA